MLKTQIVQTNVATATNKK